MAKNDEERITRLEVNMENVQTTLGAVAGDLKTVAMTQVTHTAHIGLLIRCLYGIVGMIILGVGGAVLQLVVKGAP